MTLYRHDGKILQRSVRPACRSGTFAAPGCIPAGSSDPAQLPAGATGPRPAGSGAAGLGIGGGGRSIVAAYCRRGSVGGAVRGGGRVGDGLPASGGRVAARDRDLARVPDGRDPHDAGGEIGVAGAAAAAGCAAENGGGRSGCGTGHAGRYIRHPKIRAVGLGNGPRCGRAGHGGREASSYLKFRHKIPWKKT